MIRGRVTERDLDLVLRPIARIGCVPVDVVRWLLGSPSLAFTYRRCSVLIAAGLLRREALLHGVPSLLVATRAGLRACGLEALGVARLRADEYGHHVLCARVAYSLFVEYGPSFVRTEREIRFAERGGERRASVLCITGDGRTFSHRPDFAVLASGEWPASLLVEVERTRKSLPRLISVLTAYEAGPAARVLYLTPPSLAAHVNRAIELSGATRVARETIHQQEDVS